MAGNDNEAQVKVLTTTGRVFQLTMTVNGQNFDPDPAGWVELTPAPVPVLRAKGVAKGDVDWKGDLGYAGPPNSLSTK
ncbi:hypothetical protein NLX94_08850 [Streptomyces sp. TBY4]|nr:hypothetical protein [Streptomyces sp. TBY4]